MPYLPCLKCSRLGNSSYCPSCKPRKQYARPSGRYNGDYPKNRALCLAASDICWLCGYPGADTADHVVPITRGGDHSLANLKPAHNRCNNRKGNRC